MSEEGWGQLSEDLHCLAKRFGFCPASEGEPWIAHVLRRNAVLWGGPPRVLGRVWLVTLRAELMYALVVPQTGGPHPCWPQGYSTHVMLQDVYESPCTAAQRPQAFNRSARVSLAGSSDPALCRGLVSQLFNSSSCRFSRCSFNGVFQPSVAGKFIVSPDDRKRWGGGGALRCLGSGHSVTVPAFQAFSAFFYTVDFLRTVMGLPVATLQQLEAAVVTVCSQTWSEVRPAPRLHQGCAG